MPACTPGAKGFSAEVSDSHDAVPSTVGIPFCNKNICTNLRRFVQIFFYNSGEEHASSYLIFAFEKVVHFSHISHPTCQPSLNAHAPRQPTITNHRRHRHTAATLPPSSRTTTTTTPPLPPIDRDSRFRVGSGKSWGCSFAGNQQFGLVKTFFVWGRKGGRKKWRMNNVP